MALVGRDDPSAPGASRGPLEAAVSRGLSILIAPEGNRPVPRSLGLFKRKAFLIAMATGLPVAAIVIRNSGPGDGRHRRAAAGERGRLDVAQPAAAD